ncbi:TniQ family protein [Streptomyces sp. ID05-18]|uniref:TniQ family protein n=1 Tax=Streptomyces sp. ID05-18 TaxID=3028662 RepID=UPI0029A5E30D|nr:TniQ family protein [Streptomyces sp. ID05-18]MDX3486608.1 TniQ family protein [Streptomyces sp. ID05-18]
MRLRVLPRSLAPLPEESLPGYLLRLAYRTGHSPRRIADLTGLGQRHNSIPYAHLRSLPDHLANLFSHATRLTRKETDALTLTRLADRYPALERMRSDATHIGGSAAARWAMSPSSRYCPQCLSGDGSPLQDAYGGPWHLRWHLPVAFACPKHLRLLEHTCPACEQPLNNPDNGRPGLIKQPTARGLHPALCRNPVTGSGRQAASPGRFAAAALCAAQLDAAPVNAGVGLDDADRHQLIALQRRLDTMLTPPPAQEISREDHYFFPDLIATTHLIKLSWPEGRSLLPSDALAALVDEHAAPVVAAIAAQHAGTTPVLAGTRTAPDDPVVCAALLLAADNLLGDRDLSTLTERVKPHAYEAFQRFAGYTARTLNRSRISPNLTQATSRQEPGFRIYSKLRKASRFHQFRVEEVPPVLPHDWFDNYFAGFTQNFPDATYRDDRLVRRGASFKLAELVTGRTWPQCAEALGLTPGVARYTLNALGRRLADSTMWPSFLNIVEQIATDLDQQQPRIDYANRRSETAGWRLPAADWHTLYDGLTHLAHMQATADPNVGSIIVWSEVNQADASYSPFVTQLRSRGGDARPLTSRAYALNPRVLRTRTPRLRLRNRLDLYATRLAHACDQRLPLVISMAEIVEEESRIHDETENRRLLAHRQQ